jgi:hypothetical protein
LKGKAVNVTDDPADVQIDIEVDVTETLGTRIGFTMIIIPLLVAGLPVTQIAFEVSTTLTTSPLVRVVLL